MILKVGNKACGASWRGLRTCVVAGVFALVPLSGAVAQDGGLPSLEGTTYGAMLNDLRTQVQNLRDAAPEEQDEATRETMLLIAQQNRAMIRMIDALHTQIDGLIADDRDLVSEGGQRFQSISQSYRIGRFDPAEGAGNLR